MAEITINFPNFRLIDFMNVLKEKIRKIDWGLIEDAEEIQEKKFTIAATKHGDVVVISAFHEVGEGFNRIKVFIMVDLKAIKATLTAIDVGTKVLTALGILATGTLGLAVATGKFAFSKILNYKKKKELEGFWKNVVQEVLEKDLEYKGLIIEDFEIGLPEVSYEDRMYWTQTYKTYIDLLEIKLRRKLVSMVMWEDTKKEKGDLSERAMVWRDKLFRDGVVDIFGFAMLKDAIQTVFVFTNRKSTATPLSVNEIISMTRGADRYTNYKFGGKRKVLQTICIFVSATDPPFTADVYDFLTKNYYVLGDLDSKMPLIFIVPPLEKVEPETQVGGTIGSIISGFIKKGMEIVKGVGKENVWNNIYVPPAVSTWMSQFSKIPFSNFLKIPFLEDNVLKYNYDGPITPEKYMEIVDRFLHEWREILTPEYAKNYLNLQKFYEAKRFAET
ncbi:MAG: hypothetical protein ACP6IS_03080 [Candidatus Asgardarchaeia archaeon]